MAEKKLEPVTVPVQGSHSSKDPPTPTETDDVNPAPTSSSDLLAVRKELLDAVVVHQAQRISQLERMVEKKRAKIEQLSTSQPFLHPTQPFVIPPNNPAAAAAAAAAAAHTSVPIPSPVPSAHPKTGTVGTAPQQTPPPGAVPHNPMVSPNPLVPPNPLAPPNPVMAAAMAAVAAAGHPQASAPMPLQYPFVYPTPDNPALAASLMGMMPPQVPVPPAQPAQPAQRPATPQPPQTSDGNDRKQSRYWTEDEHQRYLAAVNTCGPKNYEQISEIVGTRNAKQVRTHAQKFQKKLEREEAKRRNTLRLSGAPQPQTSIGAAAAAAVAAAAAAAMHGNVPGTGSGAVPHNDSRSAPAPTSSSSGKCFIQGDQQDTGRASSSVDGSSSTNDVSREQPLTSNADISEEHGGSSAAAAAAAAIAAEAANLGGAVLQRDGLSAVLMNPPITNAVPIELRKENPVKMDVNGKPNPADPSATSRTGVETFLVDNPLQSVRAKSSDTSIPIKQNSQNLSRRPEVASKVGQQAIPPGNAEQANKIGTTITKKIPERPPVSSKGKEEQELMKVPRDQRQIVPSKGKSSSDPAKENLAPCHTSTSPPSGTPASSGNALQLQTAASIKPGQLGSKSKSSVPVSPAAPAKETTGSESKQILAPKPAARVSGALPPKRGVPTSHGLRKPSVSSDSTPNKQAGSVRSTSKVARNSSTPAAASRITPKLASNSSPPGTNSVGVAKSSASCSPGPNKLVTSDRTKGRDCTSKAAVETPTTGAAPLSNSSGTIQGTKVAPKVPSNSNLTARRVSNPGSKSVVSSRPVHSALNVGESQGTQGSIRERNPSVSQSLPKPRGLSKNGVNDQMKKEMIPVTGTNASRRRAGCSSGGGNLKSGKAGNLGDNESCKSIQRNGEEDIGSSKITLIRDEGNKNNRSHGGETSKALGDPMKTSCGWDYKGSKSNVIDQSNCNNIAGTKVDRGDKPLGLEGVGRDNVNKKKADIGVSDSKGGHGGREEVSTGSVDGRKSRNGMSVLAGGEDGSSVKCKPCGKAVEKVEGDKRKRKVEGGEEVEAKRARIRQGKEQVGGEGEV